MMKNFKRPEENKNSNYVDTVVSCKAEMMKSLEEAVNGQANIEEVKGLIKSLIEEQDEKGFWSLIPSPEVDGDIRVLYWYEPTYIATAFIMRFYLEHKDEAENIDGFMEALKKGLTASTMRGLKGHGFDDIRGRLDALNIFAKGKVLNFINTYPNMVSDFTSTIKAIHNWLNEALATGKTFGYYREDYKADMYETNAALGCASEENILVFVYGTLMKGQSNHEYYLADAELIDTAVASKFALYDLGAYPGVVYHEDEAVKGELYKVDSKTLKKLDRLEGEGDLYLRLLSSVVTGSGKEVSAYVYVYNQDVSNKTKVSFENQPWGKVKESELVWYACYGSNINKNRFMEYINGCEDKTPPLAEETMILEHPIYFAKQSSRWENKGVAFLDTNSYGKCYGKRYLITKEQFNSLHKQEGKSDAWYNQIVDLGSEDGIPIRTITHSPNNLGNNIPHTKYLDVIKKGIQDTYPEIEESQIDAYLMGRYLKEDHKAVFKHLRSKAHGISIQQISEEINELKDIKKLVSELRELGLIKQDGRNVTAGIDKNDSTAVYYTIL